VRGWLIRAQQLDVNEYLVKAKAHPAEGAEVNTAWATWVAKNGVVVVGRVVAGVVGAGVVGAVTPLGAITGAVPLAPRPRLAVRPVPRPRNETGTAVA